MQTSSTETSTAAGEATGGMAASGDAVEISNFEFAPETLAVDAGTEVTFSNQDSAAHTATADDSSFDTDTLNKGDDATVTFDDPGTYTYYCRFHAFMKGTIEVK
jgi:plastocyanin